MTRDINIIKEINKWGDPMFTIFETDGSVFSFSFDKDSHELYRYNETDDSGNSNYGVINEGTGGMWEMESCLNPPETGDCSVGIYPDYDKLNNLAIRTYLIDNEKGSVRKAKNIRLAIQKASDFGNKEDNYCIYYDIPEGGKALTISKKDYDLLNN